MKIAENVTPSNWISSFMEEIKRGPGVDNLLEYLLVKEGPVLRDGRCRVTVSLRGLEVAFTISDWGRPKKHVTPKQAADIIRLYNESGG